MHTLHYWTYVYITSLYICIHYIIVYMFTLHYCIYVYIIVILLMSAVIHTINKYANISLLIYTMYICIDHCIYNSMGLSEDRERFITGTPTW